MSDRPNDGGSAFPVPAFVNLRGDLEWPIPGMSLRAWLAGQALAGATVNPSASDARIAQACVQLADAVLAELEK